MTITSIGTSPVPAYAKWAFTTRRVRRSDVAGLKPDVRSAAAGDLVLGEITQIGQHKRLQLSEARYSTSFVDDCVVVACGDRYAPDQFEGVAELDPDGADLIAAGGLVGRRRNAHDRMAAPTQIRPLGLLTACSGEVINLARYSLPLRPLQRDVPVICVVGSSMNGGKTTTAVSLAHGLGKAGLRVAGIKATGTGAFGDFNAFRDAGVPFVADFTDAGMASTYRQPLERIERGFQKLLAHAAADQVDVAIVELADGVCQHETARLLQGSQFRDALVAVLMAAPDALSAIGGVSILRQMGLETAAVSGMVSCSPLAAREAERRTSVPVLSRADLCDPGKAAALVTPFLGYQVPEVRRVA